MQNPKDPPHNTLSGEKECRLARHKLRMDHADRSIQHVCGCTGLKQVLGWESHLDEFELYYVTLVLKKHGINCREWPAWKTNAKIKIKEDSEKGRGQCSTLWNQVAFVLSQTNFGAVSSSTLGRLPREGGVRLGLSKCCSAILKRNWNKNITAWVHGMPHSFSKSSPLFPC